MKKNSLEDVKQLFLDIASREEQTGKALEIAIQKESDRYATLQSVKSFVDSLVSAFKKSYHTLSPEEKEKLVSVFLEKLASHVDSEVRASRDSVLISKGKMSASTEASRRILEFYQQSLDEAGRVEEVAKKISAGEEIPNGRRRRPGERPEKLSVIRKAQAAIKDEESKVTES